MGVAFQPDTTTQHIMGFDELVAFNSISSQSILDKIAKTWISKKIPLSDTADSKLDKQNQNLDAAIQLKQHRFNKLIEISSPIIEYISHKCSDVSESVLADTRGVIFHSFIGSQDYVGVQCHVFANMDQKGINALSNGIIMDLEYRENTGDQYNAIWIPILDGDNKLESVLMYGILNARMSDEIRYMVYLGAKLIESRYRQQQYTIQYANSVINGIEDCVLLLDEHYNIEQANNRAFGLLCAPNYELIGKNVRDIISGVYSDTNTRNLILNEPFLVRSNDKTIPCSVVNQHVFTTLNHQQQLMIVFRPELTSKHEDLRSIHDQEHSSFDKLIGNTPVMNQIVSSARRIAPKPSTILIEGESGTGKEVLAEAIHRESRRKGPFIPINCGAIPKELLQSELFGYCEGTFTGGKKGGKIGKFELAHNGTLFLDEIGEMPFDMQISLLRVLQDKTITPLGGNSPRKVDVRIIAATNKNLNTMVAEGSFREDLYYRLNVMNIVMPPLRQRSGDIPLITKHIVEQLCRENDMKIPAIEPEVIKLLQGYHWPGNVRELSNVIECALFSSQNNVISKDLLPPHLMQMKPDTVSELDKIQDYEKIAIINALQANDSNITHTAKALGMSRTTLNKKIKNLNINKNELSKYAVIE